MKKLITILAIVLTVQCVAQEKDSIHFNIDDRYRRIRYTIPIVDTCPEGTTWMHGLRSSGCEVVAECCTEEEIKENYEWFSKCRKEDEGSGGITALKSLNDFVVIANGKTIIGKLNKNKSNDVIVKFYNGLETPITIEYIERWIEHCYNDSTLLKHQHFGVEGEMCLIDWECISESHYKDIWIHKDPNDIVGLLKWLKDN